MNKRSTNPFNCDNFSLIPNKANREYKSSLFAFLFTRSKENALSLYNCINKSNYTNADDIKYEMLENALYIGLKNDVSFIFDKSLSLYEHQSTFNPNMPLRGLIYFADLYKQIVDKMKLYRKQIIKLPVPKYVVFYNGTDKKNIPDTCELKLSDAFDSSEKIEGYEWTATMININGNHNNELLSNCKILSDYVTFISTVRKYNCIYELKDAILYAIEECIKKDILKDVLSKFRQEVAFMTWDEFDEEAYELAVQDEINELKAEIANKDAELADKDAEIERLKAMLIKKES